MALLNAEARSSPSCPMLTRLQSKVLHSHPVASIPKSVLKAPPLDTANPTLAHSFLPVPASSAKLRTAAGSSQDISSSAIQAGTHAVERFPRK